MIGIIGCGPIGLECGLHALKHGYSFIIFESGDDIASNVRLWSHVQLFTPLHMNTSLLGRMFVENSQENDRCLTGGEYIERYLRPISQHLQSHIRLRHRVLSIGRYHSDQFIIFVENIQTGSEEYFVVECVIDASGTYSNPNCSGPGQLPAINERAIRDRKPPLITYCIPDLSGEQLAGKRIALVGKGHSAATSAVLLARLKKAHPETQLFWIIKQAVENLPYCSNPQDPLEQRQQLADDVNQIYTDGLVFTEILTNTVVTKYSLTPPGTAMDITLDTSPPRILSDIDYVIVNTGSQPDRSLYANLSVQECYRTKGPLALAVKLVSSGSTDCLKAISHGASSMLTTEGNFFIVGIKSYGKQTNFLLKIGFEQVDEVFQLISNHVNQRGRTVMLSSSQ